MRLQKSAYKRMKLEEDIKRLKLQGKTNRDIALALGLTENRVTDILNESLVASKLKLKDHNKQASANGLPLFNVANVNTDFSALSALGEKVKKYQEGTE